MSSVSRIAFFCAGLAASPSLAKGINVRFLPNPAPDSVAEYRILRTEIPGGAPILVGSVPARPARDTLSFPDTGAVKGSAYAYRIVAVDAGGDASDPSDSSEIAEPSLDLPDTLRPPANLGQSPDGIRITLAAGADPLAGSAPLRLFLEDSADFSLRYDPAGRVATFAPRGSVRSGRIVVRAEYYGKFSDRDTLRLDFGAPASVAVASASGRGDFGIPARWSPRSGGLRIRAGSPEAVAIFTLRDARGAGVAEARSARGAAEFIWDGRGPGGGRVAPACYLWSLRSETGGLLQAGVLRVDP
jgi:hypothetical protein